MAKEVTAKSTKTEILEAYNEVKAKLDAMDSMKDDPMKKVAEAEIKRISDSAETIVGKNILSPEIVGAYNDLMKDIESKKKTLKELYDIEIEANSMVAMINAHKEKEVELKAKYDSMKAELDAEVAEKKAKAQEELVKLADQKKETLENIRKESKELMNALNVERARNKEEYDYVTKRSRQKENDVWADEKATREKVLAEKEAAVKLRETEVSAKEEYIAELESKVAEIPTLVETAKAEGIKKGESDAGKSYSFEKRTIETKNEYEQKALKDTVARLEVALAAEKEAKETLQDKLDSAYAQMRELASETVKSSGGVKILDRETSGK